MLDKLRWNLTIRYAVISLVLYLVLCSAAIFVFYSQLNFVILENLRAQTREIRPVVQLIDNKPSLANWANTAASKQIEMMYTVQIFNTKGVLIEEYGPIGVHRLGNGLIEDPGKKLKVHSRPHKLEFDGKTFGYLQVQESTANRDEAIEQLILTFTMLAPILLLLLGFFGHLMAGRAIKPTEQVLTTLKHFTADTAHELNNPIALIQATIETIEKKYPDQKLATLLQNILRATERLKNMGLKLFALAKAEENQPNLSLEELSLLDLLNSARIEFAEAFSRKNINLICQNIPQEKMLIPADSLRIIINNLLENALKYTNPNGQVIISAQVLPKVLIIQVEDSGIGIPEESLNLIFQRFYRVNKHVEAIPGAGLGLAIVKAIVDSHKGEIKVDSSIGKGSKFTISIPLP